MFEYVVPGLGGLGVGLLRMCHWGKGFPKTFHCGSPLVVVEQTVRSQFLLYAIMDPTL